VRQLKYLKFHKEAQSEGILDSDLVEISSDFLGLDAIGQQRFSLGAGLYKLRLASKTGRGKSGGSRAILAYKKDDRLIWIHAFSKNDKGNVSKKDLEKLKGLSEIYLNLSKSALQVLIECGDLIEIKEK